MRFFSLANRNFKEIYRDPVSVLLGLAMPLLMLVIFTSINKKMPLEIFSPQSLTPGIAIFSFTFLIMFSAMLLARDKQNAFLIRLFTTPLRPSDYILSYTLPFLPLAFLQVVICFAAGTILGGVFVNIFLSSIIYLLVAFVCISLGVVLGSLFTVNQVSGIGSILITVISFFSGIWMDLKMVGGTFEKIGNALPFVHAVNALKALMTGSGIADILNHILIISFYAVGLFLLAVVSFMRTMKKV
jgi:ABC-2 type transport system permease protein